MEVGCSASTLAKRWRDFRKTSGGEALTIATGLVSLVEDSKTMRVRREPQRRNRVSLTHEGNLE